MRGIAEPSLRRRRDDVLQYQIMKYIIIIPDGAADRPLDELDGRTPFEAARIPHTDGLSLRGRIGTVETTPRHFKAGSDICCMSLLGYSPTKYHTGRAPLEAAALGLEMAPSDWVFRVNLVTVIDGVMQDHSAGHISSDEGRQLLTTFTQHMDLPGMTLHPGVSYRNIMIDHSATDPHAGSRPRDWTKLVTTPPHEIPDEPIRQFLPSGCRDAEFLHRIVAESHALFSQHDINKTRQELSELEATHLWPWGQGRIPQLPSFESRFGLRGAVITAVDLLAGIARYIGWDRLDVPGQTSYHDTDYAAAGRYAIEALDHYDIVCVHVEAPDEASHGADAATKVAAIEAIDQFVVGPMVQALNQRDDDWRLLYVPDHYTLVSTRKHDPTPVPFLVCGQHINSVVQHPFSEHHAGSADLHIAFGHELMEYFLFSGVT